MDPLAEAKNVMAKEAQAIQHAARKLGAGFVRAVELLHQLKGKVIISGIGKSGLVGRKIASTLASTGTPAIFLHPTDGLHGDLGLVVKGDVGLLISNSGEAEEVLGIVPTLKRLGVPLVALTGRLESSLASHADVLIDVGVDQEACPFNLVPTSSTTALMAIGDALAITLLKIRGFNEDDFASIHPKGSLGKRLLIRVDDLMHQGKDNAVVQKDTLMEEAIIEITSKGLGAVCIVDDNGCLAGIFTDGDLRRAIRKHHRELLEMPISTLMTHHPVTIRSGALAAQAFHLMEDRPSQISVLPVLDPNNQPIGILTLHALVRAGLF